jgi:hypothetical protein
LRTLQEAARGGDPEAAGVIYMLALEAAETVETLRQENNELILSFLHSMQAWPIIVTYQIPSGNG